MGTMIEGHAGHQAVEVLLRHGADTMFTLNGGHVWPFYEAARDRGMRIVDTRHEQTATFAAEAYAKLTRRPGLAVLTAGPGITNGVSAVTSASSNGSPLVVLGGRAPAFRWGAGSLQEFDHVPLLAPITKHACTVVDPSSAARAVHDAAMLARSPHRGPVFCDFPLDVFAPSGAEVPEVDELLLRGPEPDPDELGTVVELLAQAERPVFVVGSDVYWAGAWQELRAAAEHHGVPCFFNGLGRGTLPADHRLSFLRTRGLLKERADLVVVLGAPLDFRLGFGQFGSAQVAHVVDAESQRAGHVQVPTVVGDMRLVLGAIAAAPGGVARRAAWVEELRAAEGRAAELDRSMLEDPSDPIRPGRVYGELTRRLERDAVVICDGGDFASYAGKLIEVYEPGCWLDTGPFGCLGNGPGYAIAARVARPSSQIVLLLGDGAAGFSLMDVDTMVRHQLPVVMVVGNNGVWGLEKHLMHGVYGWDVACDLRPGTRYDEVVRALGGGGETVTDPDGVGPALDRAFESGLPYLVNVITDPADVYPRTANLA